MASRNFNNLRQRTLKIYDKLKRSPETEVLNTISMTVVTIEDANAQIKSLTKKAKENRALINSIMASLQKKKKPKFTELVDPFARFFFKKKKSDSDKKGGPLSWLMGLGLGAILNRMIKKLITKNIKKLVKKVVSKVKKGGKRLARYGKDVGKKVWRSTTRYAGRAVSALRPLAAAGARLAVRGVVAAGASMVGGAIGYPLMIAAAAAAVGFGAYKLGRYLKLSEKLDDFIKKVSGGKYRDIVDFITGVADGSLGKELYGWVKDKIGSLFDDAVTYLKLKTNDILGSLSPFANDPSLREGENPSSGNSESQIPGAAAAESGLDSANDSFQQQMKGTAMGAALDPMTAISGDDSAYYESNVSGAGTAWQKLTGGQATALNSGYGKRVAPKKGASTDHKGIDIKAKVGTPIYALENGTFSFNGDPNSKTGGGLQGNLKADESGLQYGFAHLSRIKAKSGPVKKGQLIALSGNSGNSTGEHIHFSIKNRSGAYINPTNVAVPTNLAAPGQPAIKQADKNGAGVLASDASMNSPTKTKTSTKKNTTKTKTKAPAATPVLAPKGNQKDITNLANSPLVNQVNIKASVAPSIASSLTAAPTFAAQSSPNQPLNMAPQIQQSSRNMIAQSTPTPASQSATSSHIGNTTSNSVKDPRGALNMDIVNAATSPLFV